MCLCVSEIGRSHFDCAEYRHRGGPRNGRQKFANVCKSLRVDCLSAAECRWM